MFLFPMISYAQNFEDVMLWRALGHVENGFYIDIGAQDPIVDSVSRAFYENGWRGVHVEPTPAYAQALRNSRPDETVLQAAIGDHHSLIPFFEIPGTGISTGDAAIAQKHATSGFTLRRIDVPCIRLSSLLDTYPDRDIHWMKIDVEGMELSVLQSWAPSSSRPWVVLVESTLPLSAELSHSAWETLVLEAGYRFAYFDGLNRFYVSLQHSELMTAFAAPPNVFDDFAMAGSGSHRFCASLNASLDRARQEIESLNASKTQLEERLSSIHVSADAQVRVAELERLLAETNAQSSQRLQDALDQSRLTSRAFVQLETAKDETLQIVRNLSAREDAYSARLAAAHEDARRLNDRLLERESLFGDVRLQLLSAQAEAARLCHELDNEKEEARTRVASQAKQLQSAVEQAESAIRQKLEKEFQAALHDQLVEHEVLIKTDLLAAHDEIQRHTRLQLAAETAAKLSAEGSLRDLAAQHVQKEQSLAAQLSIAEKRHECERSELAQVYAHRVQSLTTALEVFQQARREQFRIDQEQQQQLAATFQAAQEISDRKYSAVLAQHVSVLDATLAHHATQAEAQRTTADALERDLREQLSAERKAVEQLRTAVHTLVIVHQQVQTSWSWRLTHPFSPPEATRLECWQQCLSPHVPNSREGIGPSAPPSPVSADGILPVLGDPPSSPIAPGGHTEFLSSSVSNSTPSPMTARHSTDASVVNVDELLALHDEDFVRSAYTALLRRSADLDGFSYYLERVRHGISKSQIVAEIARSPECQSKPPQIGGLATLLARNTGPSNSLFFRLIRKLAMDALEPLALKLRTVENLLYRSHKLLAGVSPEITRLSLKADQLALQFERTEAQIKKLSEFAVNGIEVMRRIEPVLRDIVPGDSRPVATSLDVPRRKLYYYVDHTVSCTSNTGLQRVARRLGDALLKRGEQVLFVKWDPQLEQLVLLSKDLLEYLGKWNGPNVVGTDLSRYPNAGEAARPVEASNVEEGNWLLVPEVPHITFQSRAMTLDILEAGKKLGLRVAFVFHDATPLKRSELQPMSGAHREYMQHLMLADLILPNSRYSSDDLKGFLRFDQMLVNGIAPHIHSLQLPGESQLAPRSPEPGDADEHEPYVLSVGSIVPHKNQLLLIEAFNRYCVENPSTRWSLKLVGNLHPELSEQLAAFSQQNPRVSYLGLANDDDLVDFYRGCSFTVFPSVMEGFGLPILESLWFAKPCICANFGAMAEVASGGGCLPVDVTRVDDVRSAIATLIEHPATLALLSEQARNRNITSWSDYATDLLGKLDHFVSPVAGLECVYYWIDHTATYPGNSGIQRVTRGLARALIEIGARVIPCRWSEDENTIIPATPADLMHLEKWNGPRHDTWSSWTPLEQVSPRDWLLIPELTHYLQRSTPDDIRNFCARAGLRCGWVFHDAIPWKMTDIYSVHETELHRRYMVSLNSFEKIFANSIYSKSELLSFLASTDRRLGMVEQRVVACVLPGEFLGVDRVLSTKPVDTDAAVRILCVSTVEPRKNHLKLLQAVQLLQASSSIPIELTLVGSDPFPELARDTQRIADSLRGVKWIRRVDDSALRELYRECDFTVYPSRAEGFGLPILESLWNARPCICANFGAMGEVADGGGCLTVDVNNVGELADAILQLSSSPYTRERLGKEAVARRFKTWSEYGAEIARQMGMERAQISDITGETSYASRSQLFDKMPNLTVRPLLSICISTYNRAAWLQLSLQNLRRMLPVVMHDIEVLVCDNTSTDNTPDVVKTYLDMPGFKYVRNPKNVGMLGNLRVTANLARGKYVWILGDDDLLKPGSIETVLSALRTGGDDLSLLYLNYSYTHQDKANDIADLDRFLAESTPIVRPTEDVIGIVKDICAQSENFFTAIYCVVFRRDHAIRAYSQDTSGRPFSTMLTCIPTTYYVLNYMMNESARWVGTPQLVVNMNVSWMRYAPLWILERVPELLNLAEKLGGDPVAIDRWRAHNVPGVRHYFSQIFAEDPEGNAKYVSIARVVNNFKHIDEFRSIAGSLEQIYSEAHLSGHLLAAEPPEVVFQTFH